MPRLWVLVAATATCLLGAVLVAAQKAADAEAEEIATYRLTEPNLQKVINVNRAVLQVLGKEPKIQEALKIDAELDALSRRPQVTPAEEKRIAELEARKEQLEDAVDNPLAGHAESLTEMETRIQRYQPMSDALRREEMTPREYSKFWLAFLQAAFAHGFQKSGMLKQLPADVNPANVKFIADHEAEIAAMQKELELLGGGKR